MSNQVAGVPGVDATLPDVPLLIGGKLRQLCYDFGAIVQVQKTTGINLLEATLSAPDVVVAAALLWAALLRDEPELTFVQVGKWVNTRNLPAVYGAVRKAWYDSISEPDPKAGAKGKRKAQAARKSA